MWDVFISYSRKDRTIQTTLAEALRNNGLKVWTDANLVAGTPSWEHEIGKAIENSHCLIVLMTTASKDSEWVIREINFARTHQRHIIPVHLQGEEREAIPFSLTDYQRIDIRSDPYKNITLIIDVVKKYIEGERTSKIPEEEILTAHPSYQLSRYEVREASNHILIRLGGAGAKNYINMLINAFSELKVDGPSPDYYRVFDWEAKIYIGEDRDVINRIRDVLNLFQEFIFIDDFLDQTFALDSYVITSQSENNSPIRTALGELIDLAKTSQDESIILELVKPLEKFISRYPTYARSNFLLPIPSNNSSSVATHITDHLCNKLGIENGNRLVRISKKINWEQRKRNDQATLHDNFELTDIAALQGKSITIVDDVYLSGTHINELALTLRKVGAKVQAVVLTKR